MKENRSKPAAISRLPKNPYSLALASQLLANVQLFTQFEFGPTVKTLFHQIHNGTHLIAEKNDSIVGYLGWLRTTDEIARNWIEKGGQLKQQADGKAVAVTIFYAIDPKDIIRMIKAAKKVRTTRYRQSVARRRGYQNKSANLGT